jgi:hypothetical protein
MYTILVEEENTMQICQKVQNCTYTGRSVKEETGQGVWSRNNISHVLLL